MSGGVVDQMIGSDGGHVAGSETEADGVEVEIGRRTEKIKVLGMQTLIEIPFICCLLTNMIIYSGSIHLDNMFISVWNIHR